MGQTDNSHVLDEYKIGEEAKDNDDTEDEKNDTLNVPSSNRNKKVESQTSNKLYRMEEEEGSHINGDQRISVKHDIRIGGNHLRAGNSAAHSLMSTTKRILNLSDEVTDGVHKQGEKDDEDDEDSKKGEDRSSQEEEDSSSEDGDDLGEEEDSSSQEESSSEEEEISCEEEEIISSEEEEISSEEEEVSSEEEESSSEEEDTSRNKGNELKLKHVLLRGKSLGSPIPNVYRRSSGGSSTTNSSSSSTTSSNDVCKIKLMVGKCYIRNKRVSKIMYPFVEHRNRRFDLFSDSKQGIDPKEDYWVDETIQDWGNLDKTERKQIKDMWKKKEYKKRK